MKEVIRMKKKKLLLFLLVVLALFTTACSTKKEESKKETKETEIQDKKETKDEKIDISGTYFANDTYDGIDKTRYITFNSDNTLSIQVVECSSVWKGTGQYTVKDNTVEVSLNSDEQITFEEAYNFKIENDSLIPFDDNKTQFICGNCGNNFTSFDKGNEADKKELEASNGI